LRNVRYGAIIMHIIQNSGAGNIKEVGRLEVLGVDLEEIVLKGVD
jgi:hypothetical protein